MKWKINVPRSKIVLGVMFAKTQLHKFAWSHKPMALVEGFLAAHNGKGDTFRLTIECEGERFCLTAESIEAQAKETD